MNKLYSQITSLLVIVGLGTAWAFGVIDATLFTTISVTILSAIFALHQKYDKDEVVKQKLDLEDKVSILKNKVIESENGNLVLSNKLNEVYSKVQHEVIETPIEVMKPKRTKKPKTK